MGMTVLRQGVWLIGPCRTHAGRIDQLIVCLSFEEDQRRPRPPVALCLFLSIFFLPFFFHLLLLFSCLFLHCLSLSAVGLSVLSRWIYCWHQKSLQAVSLSVKGLGHLKINVLASLTCPHAVTNLYDFHSSVKQKKKLHFFCRSCTFWTADVWKGTAWTFFFLHFPFHLINYELDYLKLSYSFFLLFKK